MAGSEGKLCEAARSGNIDQVKQLVEQGERINQVDKHGETPLIIASCLGYTEVNDDELNICVVNPISY